MFWCIYCRELSRKHVASTTGRRWVNKWEILQRFEVDVLVSATAGPELAAALVRERAEEIAADIIGQYSAMMPARSRRKWEFLVMSPEDGTP